MVFSEGNLGKYLDEQGLNYLVKQLEKKFSTTGGNVDLLDYYNKEEIDDIIATISNSGDGENAVSVQNIQLINDELIITLTDGKVYNLGNVRGKNGQDGTNGTNGLSPTITENLGNNSSTYKLDIKDANGVFTTPNLKGADGSGGSSGSGSNNIYTTDEMEIGTWIDGSSIYRKVVDVGTLEVLESGNFGLKNIAVSTNVSKFIKIKAIVSYGSTTIIASPSFSNVQIIPESNHDSYIAKVEKGKITLLGNSDSIKLYYGASWAYYHCYVVAEYIKNA